MVFYLIRVKYISTMYFKKYYLSIVLIYVLIILFLNHFLPKTAFATSDPIGIWTATTPLEYSVASHTSTIYSNRLFVIGGATNFVFPTISYNTLDGSGSLQAWTYNTYDFPDPNGIYWHSTILNNDFIYILGGATFPPPNSTAKVYLGNIGSGEINNWTLLNGLPEAWSLGNSVIVNNHIFFAGGFKSIEGSIIEYNSKLLFAQINPINGTLGSWELAGNLPSEIAGFGMIASGNKITVIGGGKNGDPFSYLSSVAEYIVNDDGSLTGPSYRSPLIRPLFRPSVAKIGNYVVSVGGESIKDGDNEIIKSVYYAPIDENGSVGEWQISNNSLPEVRSGGSLTATNTHLYYTGGTVGGSYYNTVYYASFNGGGPEITPEPTPPPPGSNYFELPIYYEGRLNSTQTQFNSAFWGRLTAAFDHTYEKKVFRPFNGDTYYREDCPKGVVGISCYDSHNGTDFSTIKDNNGVITNQDVFSAAVGTVEFSSLHDENTCDPGSGGFGCVVITKYDNTPGGTLFTLYAHLEKILVNQGDNIGIETKIGNMGKTGCGSCGKHLHFGVIKEIPSLILQSHKMSKKDWEDLLFQIKPFKEEARYTPFCTYKAPNGMRFSFQDPSGWNSLDEDPWSLSKVDGGCSLTSPYLWKYNIN